MNLLLWIGQAVLAAFFAASGLVKLIQPKAKLVGNFPWMQDVSATTVQFIGALEVLGAVGLVVPALSGVAPSLTPAAATGLAVMMVLAAALHARRKEPSAVAFTAVLFVLTALVAWGRFGPYGW